MLEACESSGSCHIAHRPFHCVGHLCGRPSNLLRPPSTNGEEFNHFLIAQCCAISPALLTH